jgi:ABC-type transport system involved in multi-copper enzyme maturation permease subunit
MLDARKLFVVARFELTEAIRSRLFAVAMSLYAVGAALGSYIFLKTMAAAETAARHSLAASMRIDESSLPQDLVREKALPMFASLVEDEAIRGELLRMPPLCIFYGYMTLSLVAALVLIISAGTIATDVASGATRYALFRCDRLTWALGKLLGQEAVLAAGLLLGALVAGGVGLTCDPHFQSDTWVWLLRTSFRAWLYANAYLGLFVGLSLMASSALQARAFALFCLIGLGIAHSIVTADWANARLPGLRYVGMLFPNAHHQALWSPNWGTYLPSAIALFVIGGLGFGLGHRVFRGRDA